MKRFNLSQIMKKAWSYVKKAGLSISQGLVLAWREAKSMKETMEEKLLRLGYKVWEKGDMKRIYINDFQKYLEVEETNTPAAMGTGRIVNGICTDKCNAATRRQVLHLIDWGFGVKLYYDCKKEKWFCKNPDSDLLTKILWTVTDKIKAL